MKNRYCEFECLGAKYICDLEKKKVFCSYGTFFVKDWSYDGKNIRMSFLKEVPPTLNFDGYNFTIYDYPVEIEIRSFDNLTWKDYAPEYYI